MCCFFSSRRRHTICALVTGVQTCALPISFKLVSPGRSYVLRRKPPGQLLKGAHAVDREVAVLTGLEKASFPVAHVHGLCTDDSVIGTWFYIMDLVEGRIFWDATIPQVSAAERPTYFVAMTGTIAALQNVDYAAVGLGDYGSEEIGRAHV